MKEKPQKAQKSIFSKFATNSNEKEQFSFSAKVMMEGSTRKVRLIFASNTSFYIIRKDKLRIVIPFLLINYIYIAVYSGDLLLVTHKDKIIIDSLQMRTPLIDLIKSVSKETKSKYIRATLLDQIMAKCQYSTQLDDRNLEYKNAQIVDLDILKKKYKISPTKSNKDPLKNYILKGIMLKNDQWYFCKAQNQYNHDCIVKIYPKKTLIKDKFQLQGVFNQRNAQQGVSTTFVVNLRKAFHNRSKVCFEFNLFQGFLLSDLKRSHPIFKQKHLTRLIGEIVVGLGHLHQSNMAMINLEPKRFLVTVQGHILIHDLSYSCPLQRSISSNLPYSRYHAPQIVKYNYHIAQAELDWWGLGLLIVWMVSGKQVFDQKFDKEQLRKTLELQGKLNLKKLIGQSVYDEMPIETKEIVAKLLQKSPKDRLGSENEYLSILNEPFFKGVDKKLLISQKIIDKIKFQEIQYKDAKGIIESNQKQPQFNDQELSHFHFNRDLDSEEQQPN